MLGAEVRQSYEQKSNTELLRILCNAEDYTPEAREVAQEILGGRLATAVAPDVTPQARDLAQAILGGRPPLTPEAEALLFAEVAELLERYRRCHSCAAPTVAQHHAFLLCAPVDSTPRWWEVGLALLTVPFVVGMLQREHERTFVELQLNLCASCAKLPLTRDLCWRNPLVEILMQLNGLVEIMWPNEIRRNVDSSFKPGSRVITRWGPGIIRSVVLSGEAVVGLDTGGTVAANSQDLEPLG
jgi:hypothetical protein